MSTEAFCAQLDMGGAVSVLEALFLKAQSDLSYVACRLQQEFSEEYTAAGCSKLNPLRLLQRLTETRARVESLSSRAEKIQQQRQAMARDLQAALVRNGKQLAALHQAAGLAEPAESADDMALLAACANDEAPPSGAAAVEEEDFTEHNDENQPCQPNADGAVSKPKPPRVLRNTFDPITEQEFGCVSELVRGRVKLEEVNKVYESICTHFNKKKAQPLSVQDLTTMGLRVTGQTGEAKLKVLRALKIINVNKEGITLAY